MARSGMGKMYKWSVVYDGPSLPMIASPDGRIFRVEQLGAGKGAVWGPAHDDEELCASFVDALNAALESCRAKEER